MGKFYESPFWLKSCLVSRFIDVDKILNCIVGEFMQQYFHFRYKAHMFEFLENFWIGVLIGVNLCIFDKLI